MQTPISFRCSVFAARCSSVLTLTLYFGVAIVAPTVFAPIFSRYDRPGSISSSCIQMSIASNWSAMPAGESAATSMSPRLMSISSVSVIVIDWPATACSRSPSRVTMRATVLSLPEGSTRRRSPVRTDPPTMRPEKPRKSRFGRFTHCTGMRNGPFGRSSAISTVSR